MVETRFEKNQTKNDIMIGVWNRGNDEMENDFPITGVMNLEKHGIGNIPWKLAVFKEGINKSKIESLFFNS